MVATFVAHSVSVRKFGYDDQLGRLEAWTAVVLMKEHGLGGESEHSKVDKGPCGDPGGSKLLNERSAQIRRKANNPYKREDERRCNLRAKLQWNVVKLIFYTGRS